MHIVQVQNTDEERIEARQKIFALQDMMQEALECGLFQEDKCTRRDVFAPGLYARELTIPAGTMIVGKIHKHAHVNNISKGRIVVFTEFGSETLVAPCQFVSLPGTKRAVYAETETIWTTYHPTEETDLEKIESDVIAKNYTDLETLSYIDIKGAIQ